MDLRKNLLRGPVIGIFMALILLLLGSAPSWGDTPQLVIMQNDNGSLNGSIWTDGTPLLVSWNGATASTSWPFGYNCQTDANGATTCSNLYSCVEAKISWDASLNNNAGGWVIFGTDAGDPSTNTPSTLWKAKVTCTGAANPFSACTLTVNQANLSTNPCQPATALLLTSSVQPVDGACGLTGTVSSVPIDTALCSSGQASPSSLSGTAGPWSWTCQGLYGGYSANCSAQLPSYIVSPSAGTGGTISPSSNVTVQSGKTTSFTLTPSSGYTIGSVSGTCGGTLSGSTLTTSAITSNCTVSASFNPILYWFVPQPGPNGTMSPSINTQVQAGNTLTVTITPNSGYVIQSVAGCGGRWVTGSSTFTTGPMVGNCGVAATFVAGTPTPTSYTVTPSAGTGGSISPATPVTVQATGSTSFQITPSSGYTIQSVSGCNGVWSGGSTYWTGAITGNCTVSAAFSPTTSGGGTPLTFGQGYSFTLRPQQEQIYTFTIPTNNVNGSPMSYFTAQVASITQNAPLQVIVVKGSNLTSAILDGDYSIALDWSYYQTSGYNGTSFYGTDSYGNSIWAALSQAVEGESVTVNKCAANGRQCAQNLPGAYYALVRNISTTATTSFGISVVGN